jgi:outer membrane protein assembly complex protein YaeT
MASQSGLHLRYQLVLLTMLTMAHAADLAAPSEVEGKSVAGLRFEPPAQSVAPDDLNRIVSFPAGARLHLADVRAAIKRLYGTGNYDNVEVETEPAGNGVTLVFRTTPQWFVGPVEIRGKISAPPNSGQIANSSGLDLGAPFSEGDVEGATDHLRGLLESNGLYLATVKPEVVRDPQHQQVAITFTIDSGKRARLTLPNVIGDTKIPPADVAHAAKYKEILFFPWKPATQAIVQNGLQSARKQYEKQDRLTASVTLDHSDYLDGENRVRPTIQADGGPKIKVNVEGAKVSKGTMKKYIPILDEATVNRDLLVAGARNLRDYFQNKGYFDVEVDFTSHDPSPDLENITYTVSLGDLHRVVSLIVKGNRYFSTEQIRERMFLQPKGTIRFRHGRYSQSFATRDEQAIQALYRDNGFRDCQVTADVLDNYRGKTGDVALVMTIVEGPQYRIANLVVNGITLPNKDAILSHLGSSPGQPFSETTVATDRDYILEVFQSSGYPDATFDSKNTPGSAPYQVNLQYNVTAGMPQYVRDVLISGRRATRPRLIDPLVTLHSGDPLSWTEMGRMQRRLYNLGVFDKVDMAIQNPDGDIEQKYVDFHLVEGHLYTMAIGVGAEVTKIGGSATSVSAPNGTNGFAPRVDLELTRLNMWGLGHSVMFKGRYSTLDRRIALDYLAPRFHNVEGRNITLTGLYDNTRDVLTFTALRLQGGMQVSQRMSKATHLLFRYSWTRDLVDQTTLKINPLLIPLYSQPAQVGLFGMNLVQDRRDNPADAHRGIYNSFDVGLASNNFGGSKNFVRFLGRNSYYKSIRPGIVLGSNTEFGVLRPFNTGTTSSADYVPLPERFFGGGADTMRGFPLNQAGPRDHETGFPLGGNALLFHSTELRFPLIGDNISGVLFHDMGNVYSELRNLSFRVHQSGLTDFDYMVHAAGFGIRYKTPLGPVRVDLAYSINPPTYKGLKGTYRQLLLGGATPTIQNVSHFQFFFSIGQAF